MRSFFLLLLVCSFSACTEHRPGELYVAREEPETEEEDRPEKFSGLRVYEGTIPCADCAAIEQRLSLKGDSAGIYRLREIYKDATEDGDSELVSNGEWKKVKTKTGYVYYLSEKNIKDSIRTMNYVVNADNIMQLDRDGEMIGSLKYTLKLVAKK